MSDQPTPPPLPAPTTQPNTATFTFPHILLGIGRDAHGFVARQIREGESRQVEYVTTVEYADEPVEETPFAIRGVNYLRFGGNTVPVLNDEIALGDLVMPASNPSAGEYLAQIGQPVLIYFECRRSAAQSQQRGVPTYRISRSKITLL